MSPPKASVIVCTHNPRENYLARVIGALQAQTLARSDWELLLVDNASSSRLKGAWDLSWHPNGRHIREDELGLTPARLRSIAEARGELLVFVDDDNIVDVDYLAAAIAIASAYPHLGAFGGSCSPEFETAPPPWLSAQEWRLGIRKIYRDIWSNDPQHWDARPFGAGLCIRSLVARSYSDAVLAQAGRRLLGRRGQSLFSDEDHDLVEVSANLRLGWGVFERLKLTHLIPSARTTEAYFERLIEGQAASRAFRRALGGEPADAILPPQPSPLRGARTFLRHGARAARFRRAECKGTEAGLALFNSLTGRTRSVPYRD